MTVRTATRPASSPAGSGGAELAVLDAVGGCCLLAMAVTPFGVLPGQAVPEHT